MKKMIAIILFFVLFFGSVLMVYALPPAIPSAFHGTITLNGNNVPDGTYVMASVGGKVMASTQTTTYQGESVYSIIVPECRENALIIFYIGGQRASQIARWHSGTSVLLNLSAWVVKRAVR